MDENDITLIILAGGEGQELSSERAPETAPVSQASLLSGFGGTAGW